MSKKRGRKKWKVTWTFPITVGLSEVPSLRLSKKELTKEMRRLIFKRKAYEEARERGEVF